jgi:small subunit ribosomal protein S21
MIVVRVYNNDVDFALRILKKQVQKSGLLRELRRNRYYEKPSERQRRQKREGIKNARKLKESTPTGGGLGITPKGLIYYRIL